MKNSDFSPFVTPTSRGFVVSLLIYFPLQLLWVLGASCSM